MKSCPSCQYHLYDNEKICPQCGAQIKKPIFKKWWFWVIVACVGIIVALYIIGSTVISETQKDLLDYLNEDRAEINQLSEDFDSYASDMIENYTDDATMYTQVEEDILPTLYKIRELCKEVETETEEVQSLHNTFSAGVDKYIEAMELLKEALDEGSSEKVEKANELLEEAEDTINKYEKDLGKLAEEYSVELVEK